MVICGSPPIYSVGENRVDGPGGEQSGRVVVDGEEVTLHITSQSVMFEKCGRVSGFERSAIRMVKPDGIAFLLPPSAA